jgi:hypothetical protein
MMTTSQITLDSKLVRRLERAYDRAIRAEENAATLPQAYRLAAASERCLRRLQAARAGLPLPEPRLPDTARNRAKRGLAALAAIGRVIARAVKAQAALRKAQVALAARKVARLARQAFRRAALTVARLALRAVVLVVSVITPKKEILVMKTPKLAARITVTRNFGHSGVAVDGRVLGFFDMDGPDGAPERFRLGCWLIDDRFVFKGGIGEHSLAADELITSADRLLAHWQGYCDNTVRAFALRQHHAACRRAGLAVAQRALALFTEVK